MVARVNRQIPAMSPDSLRSKTVFLCEAVRGDVHDVNIIVGEHAREKCEEKGTANARRDRNRTRRDSAIFRNSPRLRGRRRVRISASQTLAVIKTLGPPAGNKEPEPPGNFRGPRRVRGHAKWVNRDN